MVTGTVNADEINGVQKSARRWHDSFYPRGMRPGKARVWNCWSTSTRSPPTLKISTIHWINGAEATDSEVKAHMGATYHHRWQIAIKTVEKLLKRQLYGLRGRPVVRAERPSYRLSPPIFPVRPYPILPLITAAWCEIAGSALEHAYRSFDQVKSFPSWKKSSRPPIRCTSSDTAPAALILLSGKTTF